MQIQQLLSLVESTTVKEAIKTLIGARPGSAESSSDSLLSTRSMDAVFSQENKRLSIKRKSVALSNTKCICGKCSKCIPSPSGKYETISVIILILDLFVCLLLLLF